MSPSVVEDAIRQFGAVATARGHRRGDLSLYGGEPLLNGPAVEAALAEVARQRDAGFAWSIVLNTNGTLLRGDWPQRLAAAGVDLHVSLDGPDEVANGRRVNRGGKSSWPAVLAGLRAAREAGCALQINSVLTAQDPVELRSLADFAAELDIRRIFMALPDGAVGVDGAAARADLLLTARAYARSRGVSFFGPWRVGLRRATSAIEWPPLNVIVRPEGTAFLPYAPSHRFADVAMALAPTSTEAAHADWSRAVAGCQGCPAQAGCQGYLKMMVRYHTGDTVAAAPECATALAVLHAATNDPDHELVRTTTDLRVIDCGEGEVEIANPLLANSTLRVSRDALQVLAFFGRSNSFAGMSQAFEATNLRDAFTALRSRRLLVPPAADTHVLLWEQLTSPETHLLAPPFRLGGTRPAAVLPLQSLADRLAAALARLPRRLVKDDTAFCVLGVADAGELAALRGADPNDEVLGWLAATVWHSMLVVNMNAWQRVLTQGGHARHVAFERGLVHELAHLALRQAGVRVPVWLEEGLCEHLSSPPPPIERLCEAVVRLADFQDFAHQCRAVAGAPRSHATNLLQFSLQPVDRNSGYRLAHDLVAYVDRTIGLEPFLDALVAAGPAALADPFVTTGVPFADLLTAWGEDLQGRTRARHDFDRPMRFVAEGDRAVLYHRMAGGFVVTRTADPAALAAAANQNFPVDEVQPLLASLDRDDPLLARWTSGVYAEKAGRHLRLTVADGCNMGCSYCYEGPRRQKTMSIEVADRAVAAWRDLLRPGDLARSTIRFFGGEPLLNWPVVDHVLRTGAIGLDGEPRWLINTNGTVLEDHHVRAFAAKGERLSVALSMDGVGDDHDRRRTYKNGRGTFAAVDRAAQALAAARIPFTLSAVVGDHNLAGLLDLARYAIQLRQHHGAPVTLSLEPILSPGGTVAEGEALLATYERVLDFCAEAGLPVGGKLFYAVQALHDVEGATGHFCSVTTSELSVGPTGELLVCNAIPGSGYGHLDDVAATATLPIPDDYRQRTGDRVEHCRGCEVEGLCGGGCSAQSIRATGQLLGNPGPVFCTLVRGVFRHSMRQLLRRSATDGAQANG